MLDKALIPNICLTSFGKSFCPTINLCGADMGNRQDDIGNPPYPDLGTTVAKLRRKAETVCIVHRAVARREHGLAVLAAITGKNAKLCQRELREHRPDCASGTSHSCGKAILKAVRQQNWSNINPDTIRAKRTIAEIESAYEAAMAAKRKREASSVAR